MPGFYIYCHPILCRTMAIVLFFILVFPYRKEHQIGPYLTFASYSVMVMSRLWECTRPTLYKDKYLVQAKKLLLLVITVSSIKPGTVCLLFN